MSDAELEKPFEPSVAYDGDRDCTEMIIRDCVIVWRLCRFSEDELGYDMKTGELIAIRLANGDFTKKD